MKKYVVRMIDSIITMLSVLVFLVAAFTIISVIQTPRGQMPTIFGRTMFQVISPSMEPTLKLGTVVMVKQVNPSEIQEGDIISFYSRDPDIYKDVVTHRVDEVRRKKDGVLFFTKGDANPSRDKYSVRENQFIGKVVGVCDALGSFVMLLNHRWIFILLIIVPMGYILISNGYRFIKSIRKVQQEEEEKE